MQKETRRSNPEKIPVCSVPAQNLKNNPAVGGYVFLKYPHSSETRKCAHATIKGDIIKANKALRKTNMLTERTHLRDCTAGCLMDLIKTTQI